MKAGRMQASVSSPHLPTVLDIPILDRWVLGLLKASSLLLMNSTICIENTVELYISLTSHRCTNIIHPFTMVLISTITSQDRSVSLS